MLKKKWVNIIIVLPFMLCAGFLFLLGKCFRLSYKQISVIFNLYLQGGLLTLTGIMPLAAIIWKMKEYVGLREWVLLLGSLSYASIYIVAFVSLLRHYHLPMNDAFDLCVKDLQILSSKWSISYHALNLIIFICWWLALVGINIFIAFNIAKNYACLVYR